MGSKGDQRRCRWTSATSSGSRSSTISSGRPSPAGGVRSLSKQLTKIANVSAFLSRLMEVFQILLLLRIVKLSNPGLQLLNIFHRWDPQFEQATYKNHQRLYFSEHTGGSVPNTLVVANCEIVKPRVAAAKHILQEFCSVGDDACVIFWDARVGSNPVIKVEKAHQSDVYCVDWNRHDENLILTGSADNSVRMFDRRNLISGGVGSPVHKFEAHSVAVLCVQWCPNKASVFGSSAQYGELNIWDHEKVGKKSTRTAANSRRAAGLFFQHAGHRGMVVDFHWNASDPWTIVSVSNDWEIRGGGTLQIWRMSDFFYRPEEEVLEELEKFLSYKPFTLDL